jgi:hypothetical protein
MGNAAQELERALEGSLVRAGSGVAVAEGASAAQSVAPQAVQFAEAQRIIVLDAVRTDFSHSGLRPSAGAGSSAPAIRGGSWGQLQRTTPSGSSPMSSLEGCC